MQFITIAAALLGAAVAAPAPQTAAPVPGPSENVDISEYYLRKNNGVQFVYFKLSGDAAKDLECTTSGPVPTIPSEVFTCGDSKYRFSLKVNPTEGDDNPFLAIYHEVGVGAGLTAVAPGPPLYCRAGGNGFNDFICTQVNPYTISITNGFV